jgi:hypothetical protein
VHVKTVDSKLTAPVENADGTSDDSAEPDED